jgi:serine/threonine protein kinase
MVMDLLGPNLETIMKQKDKPFSVSTTSMIGIQMLRLIRHLHSENFTVGLEGNKIFMIDFGLAKYYRDPRSKNHIGYRNDKSLVGTARYASINTHVGIDQTRRDDIESFLYVLIYFLKGELPWQRYVRCMKREKLIKITECKLSIPIESLCKGLPMEFSNLLSYARLLKYEDKPDYLYIQNSLMRFITTSPTLLFERVIF